MSEKKRGRRREFDGPPVSVRLTQQMYDSLAREALRRGEELSKVIRERLDRPAPNSYPKYGSAKGEPIH